MSTKITIHQLARSKKAFDAEIFKHLYELNLAELVSTLAASGLPVKPAHVLKSELIKPLTREIVGLAKKARLVDAAPTTTKELNRKEVFHG